MRLKPNETAGAEGFHQSIATVPRDLRPDLQRLHDFAVGLERAGLARLVTMHGQQHGRPRWSLRVGVPGRGENLVVIWNEETSSVPTRAFLNVVWTRIEALAPGHAPTLRRLFNERKGPTNPYKDFLMGDEIDEIILAAVRDAYVEANGPVIEI